MLFRSIERTKIIAHIIDMSGSEGRDPYEDYLTIRKELESFSEKLINKKEIIIANKMDIESSKDNLDKFRRHFDNIEIFEIEAINNKGLDKVINRLQELVDNTEDEILFDKDIQEKHVLYKFKSEKPFTINRVNNTYIVSGEKVEKLFKMTNFNTEEALDRFAKKLRHMGIDEELEKMGIQEGDIVKIMDYEFEYTK